MAYAATLEPEIDRPDARTIDSYLGPVNSIGVFRALGLGDLICATPALRSLRRRFPGANITLISLPWAAEFASRLSSVDDFVAFPGHPELPEHKPDLEAWPAFMNNVRGREFDLLLQLHGSGRVTNQIVTQWGARHVAAFHEAHRLPPEPVLGVHWPESGTETQRLLTLVSVLGQAPWPDSLRLEFPISEEDRDEAEALLLQHGLGQSASQSYVCLHAGSQLPSRRWPLPRFIEVAKALVAEGHPVVLTGVKSEAHLGAEIEAALQGQCINLIGKTSLWSLGALIQGARLLICNDTGVSHIAAALGTHSVVISCGSDVARWAPVNHGLHRVLWAGEPCRPCSNVVCPTEHECAWAISSSLVIDAAMSVLMCPA